ncbi:hypothetical protein FNW02_21725 [Komarekiella sp. 'clone 1']|uniref:Uncharacterized protein n=1 Tax=Komarekiella delphini-convector SJRDD-AB1 TaxID=2593771 RepID=A0AA40SZX4_9NOST|nr:hypothetical protein [Komarekiella delphini-convector]MBD6618371.1 hypothetical protein [Komarekiella delphini-convector SJRDD-AB1]
MVGNLLQCEYLGWGKLEPFRARSLSENEALIFTAIAGTAPVLIRGFLNCLRSPELEAKIPQQFSENDVAGVMVEMVRTLPESLLQQWANQSNTDQTMVCAILRWTIN